MIIVMGFAHYKKRRSDIMNLAKLKKLNLAGQIAVAMLAGILVGAIL